MIQRRTAIAILVGAGSAAAIDTREAAPRFRAKTLDGERLDNDSLKGKVVLLQFWTTWCQYCRRDQPAVNAIVEEFGKQGVVVVGVNVGESRKKVRQYLDDNPRSCRIVLTDDTNLAALFAARGFPLYVLIDREGKIVGKQSGAGGEESLRRMLRKAGIEAD